jgi:hypothetical protein
VRDGLNSVQIDLYTFQPHLDSFPDRASLFEPVIDRGFERGQAPVDYVNLLFKRGESLYDFLLK